MPERVARGTFSTIIPTLPSDARNRRPTARLRSAWATRLGLGILILCQAVQAVAPRPPEGPWWSLQPVARPEIPGGDPGSDHPIDRFLAIARTARGLRPHPRASRLALLRRVHLDLTGLPPTPAEQEAFLADPSADAYEKVVDRLLADEQHAVRYARHWLDVLRYADTDEQLSPSSGIHLWRDWIIRALHEDMPFDQFVQIQLTGRRSRGRSRMSATGHRFQSEPRPGDLFALGLLARGVGADPQDLAINAVDTVSSAFLGMTVACAKCHDHVHDPVKQSDYYAMKALFDPLVIRKVTLAPAADLVAAGRAEAEIERARAPLQRELDALVEPVRKRLRDERITMLPAGAQAIFRKAENERTPEEQRIADDYFPILRIDDDKIDEVIPEALRKEIRALRRRIDEVGRDSGRPKAPVIPVFQTVEVDRDRAREKRYVLTSADPSRPEKNREVTAGWPFATATPDLREGPLEAFTDWLTSPEHPLFARVAVNRLWQWHFGTGLHRQPSDFGRAAGTPTHPQLLDWLASEFVRSGFSQRHIHRCIVTSAAYRLASETGPADADNHERDPDNRTLWRHPVRRLEAETVWDGLHAAAQLLDLQVGGPSFEAPEGGGSRRGTPPPPERHRRGAYMVRGFSTSREATPEFLRTFDAEDGREPCPMRTRTVTAPQALFLMNSREVDRAATALAVWLRSECQPRGAGALDADRAIDLAFRRVLSRPPTATERTTARTHLDGDPDRLEGLAWMLFNLDEFLHVP